MPPTGPPLALALRAYLELGIAPNDDEAERFRTRTTAAVTTVIAVTSISNAVALLVLERPLTAAIELSSGVACFLLLAFLFATKRGDVFVGLALALGFMNPILVMWSLGGFAQGGAAILWSFSIPLAALVFWGTRSAGLWSVACAGALVVSGLLESTLRSLVDPLPAGLQTGLFVFVIASASVVNLAVLLYFVRQRDIAFARSESLLLNILPAAIAERLKARHADVADRYEAASVLFIDIVDFTAFADRTPAERLVELLGQVFTTLDDLAERHRIEKIKTLGDGYLAVSGVPVPRLDHAQSAARMALETPVALEAALGADWPELRVRVGLASGPLVAGVIGRRRFSYDVWGDTVNTASRMASLAKPGEIAVTAETASALAGEFTLEPMPEVTAKGKGIMRPFRLAGPAVSA